MIEKHLTTLQQTIFWDVTFHEKNDSKHLLTAFGELF